MARYPARRDVQCSLAGGASPGAPPAWAHPAVRGHGSDRGVAYAGDAGCPHGPTLDCPGEAAAHPVATGTLQPPQ